MVNLVSAGIFLILAGFLLVFMGSLGQLSGEGDTKVSVVGFIGPFPIGFGNDKQFLALSIIIGIAIIFLISLYWRP